MTIAEIPVELTTELLGSVGRLGLYLQAAGIIVIIWLGVQITNLIINYRSKKRIVRIEQKLDSLISKIDKTSKKKK